ncbi:hypothetical protein D1816_09375 [Aquimarina sp. AD10]|uniref:c-type cytochrome domain-containing protein n=1 Tax=Aquimarina TaxID=290174 RepID=UPI000E4708C3|nr:MULTISPECIES: c-type cytochrome domain-containing protein [Aquimarina]AXT60550.1 hypothetical protein D1816_09375 [Aquimarina sp. AD10]RKN01642.1 hypothetical protein D7033_03240 [Aquimarina sp. AD10]
MNEVSDIVLFFGRFHPLVVHLPIGFLFFAFILEVYGRWQKDDKIKSAIPLSLFLGAISALVACVLGYMLSLSGDYDQGALDTHFWFGIATTVIAFGAWLISSRKLKVEVLEKGKAYIATLALIVVLLSITGHYGGNLTHGSDYLTAYLPFGKEQKEKLVAVTSIEEAQVFNHLVNPILQDKCASCHNASKKKGQLSFASKEAILKGGKSGAAFVAGDAGASEMIRRVLLDTHHDEFMPPEGKTPLTKEEIAIIEYWVNTGQGDFEIKFGNIESSEEIKLAATEMLGLDASTKESMALANVPSPSETDIKTLIDAGFKIRELVADSNLFDVILPAGTINQENITDVKIKLELLKPLKKNIIWLSVGDNNISDNDLSIFDGFENLQLLKLEKNPITDKGISLCPELKKLTALNLFGTKVSKSSLELLNKFPKLEKLYVWNTNITKEDVQAYRTQNNSEVTVNL